jgi:hypothetical protein
VAFQLWLPGLENEGRPFAQHTCFTVYGRTDCLVCSERCGSVGKFVVALAPPTSPPAPGGIQVLYATIEGQPLNRPRQATDAPDPIGVFRSIDQGVTWNLQTPPGAGIPPASGMPLNTQGGYSFHMAVDPASPGDGIKDIIYLGTVDPARSVDSGKTFVALSGLHPDTHTWAFAPQPGPFSVVYCGNDGGLFTCTVGVNFISRNAGGLQTALFYNLDVNRDAAASVTLGALQDNGIVTTSGVTPTVASPQKPDSPISGGRLTATLS